MSPSTGCPRRACTWPSSSTYRSHRYQDEANTEGLAAGWLFGVHAYWESPDKRLYTEALIDNIKGRQGVSAKPSIYGMRLGYRF